MNYTSITKHEKRQITTTLVITALITLAFAYVLSGFLGIQDVRFKGILIGLMPFVASLFAAAFTEGIIVSRRVKTEITERTEQKVLIARVFYNISLEESAIETASNQIAS